MTEIDKLAMGPRDGVNYPIHVPYCGNCSMPIEVRNLFSQKLHII